MSLRGSTSRDRLAGGSRSSDELAAATDTHSDALYRLLRALAAAGVLHERTVAASSSRSWARDCEATYPEASTAGR